MTNFTQKIFDMNDNQLILEFFMPGRPATKKTSQRIVKRGKFIKILPSLRYENYEKLCKETFENVWKNKGNKPIPCGIAVKLLITLDSWVVGDETGYQQAFGDILEKYEIIANDQLIHWVDDNTHMFTQPNKLSPGVTIKIYRFRHPLEARAAFLKKFEDDTDQVIKTTKKSTKPNKRKKKQ